MWHVWQEEKCMQGFLVTNLEEKKPRGRPSHIWEDNIKIDLFICSEII